MIEFPLYDLLEDELLEEVMNIGFINELKEDNEDGATDFI